MAGRRQSEDPELVYGLVVANESEIVVAYPNLRLFQELSKDALEQLPPYCARFTLGFDDAMIVFWRCQGVVYMLGCHACFTKKKSWELLGNFRRIYLQAVKDLRMGRWLGQDASFQQELSSLVGATRGKMKRSPDLVIYPDAPNAYRTAVPEPPPPSNPNWKSLQEELEDLADSDEDTEEEFLDSSSTLSVERTSEGSEGSGEMVRSESVVSGGHGSWSMELSVQNDLRIGNAQSCATAEPGGARAAVPRAPPTYNDFSSRGSLVGKASMRSRVSYQSQELSRVSPEEKLKVLQTDNLGGKQVRDHFVSERGSVKRGVIPLTSPGGLTWEEHIRRERVAHGLAPPRPFTPRKQPSSEWDSNAATPPASPAPKAEEPPPPTSRAHLSDQRSKVPLPPRGGPQAASQPRPKLASQDSERRPLKQPVTNMPVAPPPSGGCCTLM